MRLAVSVFAGGVTVWLCLRATPDHRFRERLPVARPKRYSIFIGKQIYCCSDAVACNHKPAKPQSLIHHETPGFAARWDNDAVGGFVVATEVLVGNRAEKADGIAASLGNCDLRSHWPVANDPKVRSRALGARRVAECLQQILDTLDVWNKPTHKQEDHFAVSNPLLPAGIAIREWDCDPGRTGTSYGISRWFSKPSSFQ